MPQRTLNLLAALAGLIIVAALFALGCDLHRAARTGPRWKRRLVGAALALLALFSPLACGRGADSQAAPIGNAGSGKPADKARTYAETNEWKRLLAIWKDAAEIAAGKRGAYPFDRAGKKKTLEALANAAKDLDTLQGAGLLSPAEVGLLKQDLAQLTRGVQAKRPTEMRMATCYEPMWFDPAGESLKRLQARTPFLEALARTEKLRPEVVRKALASVEKDLATLGDEKALRRLRGASRAEAAAVRDAVRKHVEKIKAALEGGRTPASTPLDRSPDWKTVADAWAFVTPFARSGKSTTAQRKEADQKMAEAAKAIAKLKEASLLAEQEAQLLTGELANIREDITRDPPTDTRVKCYDMMSIPPARKSFGRLAKRLPLVEKLAADGTLKPPVAAKLLASIRADMAVLADAAKLAQLPEPERAKAQATRDRAAKLAQQLK